MQDEYLEQGIAIIANPEAGELFTLERDERNKVLQICVEEAAGRCPVMAGVVHVHTKGYIETAKDAQELQVFTLPYLYTAFPTHEIVLVAPTACSSSLRLVPVTSSPSGTQTNTRRFSAISSRRSRPPCPCQSSSTPLAGTQSLSARAYPSRPPRPSWMRARTSSAGK